MFSRKLSHLPCILVLSLTVALPARAQVTTATFYGIVNDPSGAIVPGAEVTLVNENTSASLRTVTDSVGEFVFNFVAAGRYTLKISLPGFKTLESKNMELGAGQNSRQTFTLQVGEVTESVTVTGESPLVNTAAPEQRENFSRLQVMELPLARRNFSNILRLGTGVTTGGSGQVRLNGAGRSGTRVTVDGTGADPNPEAPGTSMYQAFNLIDVMSIEAVQEVQTIKGIIAAEYGHVLTGNVNLITRSGTNSWHGSLFENLQMEELNARTQTATTRPPLTFNQFGGSVGGPIRKPNLEGFEGNYLDSSQQSFYRSGRLVGPPVLLWLTENAPPVWARKIQLWKDIWNRRSQDHPVECPIHLLDLRIATDFTDYTKKESV